MSQTEILQLKNKVSGLDREISILKQRGENSIGLIRSKLNLLNLSEGEDVSDLEIESASVEMHELRQTASKLKEKKELLVKASRELKKIREAF